MSAFLMFEEPCVQTLDTLLQSHLPEVLCSAGWWAGAACALAALPLMQARMACHRQAALCVLPCVIAAPRLGY